MESKSPAIAETADIVSVIRIVIGAISGISVCTQVLLVLQHSNFTVSLLKPVSLSFFAHEQKLITALSSFSHRVLSVLLIDCLQSRFMNLLIPHMLASYSHIRKYHLACCVSPKCQYFMVKKLILLASATEVSLWQHYVE